MHYEEYCKSKDVHLVSPLSSQDIYQDLSHIAMRRLTVLTEFERMPVKRLPQFYEIAGRCIDLFLSCIGLIVGAVLFLVIAIAIKLDSRGPIFYRQTRVGKGGKVFKMIKFRTMVDDAEIMTGPVWAAKDQDDPRLTRVGKFLRNLRLDEVPQLFNILTGEMSFVGPRPERPEFVYGFIRCIPAFDRRHEVKPGIAGLAQLKNGYDTSATSIYKKLRWDIQYMKKKCIKTDFCILYRTVIAVLRGEV